MKTGKWLFILAIAAFVGCSKPSHDDLITSGSGDPAALDPLVYYSGAKGLEIADTKFPETGVFCEYEEYKFIAGQTIDAGYILVGNTKDSLFLEITSTKGFQNIQENVKIWIGSEMPFTRRPATGSFPFKYSVPAGDTVLYLGFSFAELELKCDAAFFIIIHGDVLAPAGETAFAGDIEGSGSSWWNYINYTPECCEPPVECKISAAVTITDVKCFGESNGAVDLTVQNGTAPLTYLWSNGATTEDLTNIPAGTYSVTVTDANKCIARAAEIIVKGPLASISASRLITNISAFGANDGAINVTVAGGTEPYAFLWNTGATTEDISGLAPGTYSLLITDLNNCSTELKGILIEQPEEEKPKGVTAFARKTYEPMVHCFLKLDMDDNGSPDFTDWGWTNGAMPEDPEFISKYELFIGASGCNDMTNATKVGDVTLHHFGGVATVNFKALPGYSFLETALYVGNEMLPKADGAYTVDPARYPSIHKDLGGVTTDTYNVQASGDVYIIAFASVIKNEADN